MSLHLFVGPAESGKSSKLNESIMNLGSSKKIIYIVPEQYALSAEKKLALLSSGHGIMNIEVLSFSRLSYKIMEAAGAVELPVLDDMGKTLFIKRIMQEHKKDLVVFSGKENNIGFLDEIKSTISELSQYCVTPEAFDISSNLNSSLLKYKIKDIALIYGEYQKRVEGFFKTQENVLSLCFKHILDSEFLNDAILVLDSFTGLTPIQYQFLENLLSKTKELYATITCEIDKLENTTSGLFEMSSEYYRKLIEVCNKNGVVCSEIIECAYKPSDLSIEHLKANIFHYPSNIYEDIPSGIVINSLKSRKEECRYICSEISRLLRTGNYQYSDFAILSGDLAGIKPFICQAMKEYDLRGFIDASESVESNPLISFLNAALNVVATNFKSEAVIDFISSPLSGFSLSQTSIFSNYLMCYGYRGIKKYKDEWIYETKLRKRINLDDINQIRAKLYHAFSLLPANFKEVNTKQLVDSIFKFFEEFQVYERLNLLGENLSEDHDLLDLKNDFSTVYKAVKAILEQIVCIIGDDKVSFREFNDIFMGSVRKLSLGKLPRYNDVIMVGDIIRSRIDNVKFVFIADCNEGIIPRKAPADSVLTIEDRHVFLENGIELAPQIKDKPEREEFYVYLAACKPVEKLYLSYHRVNEAGNNIKESYIINSVLRIFKELDVLVDDLDNLAGTIGFDKGISYYLRAKQTCDCDNVYKALDRYYKEKHANEVEETEASDSLTINKLVEVLSSIEKFGSLEENISEEAAKELYENLSISVTRIESFAKCPFAHFAKFGLGLQEMVESQANEADYGNVIHGALKLVFEKYKHKASNGLSDNQILDLAENYVEEVASSYNDGVYTQSNKNLYLIERMKKVMRELCKVLLYQVRVGKYEPDSFEQRFKVKRDEFTFNGAVDRIDTANANGEKYLKIIDYKTGKNTENISYQELYYGLQLQLLFYLNIAINDKYKNYKPGAAVYQMIREPENELELTGEALDAAARKSLRPNGVINNGMTSFFNLDTNIAGEDGTFTPAYTSLAAKFGTTSTGKINYQVTSKTHTITSEDIIKLASYADTKVKSLGKDMMSGKTEMSPVANVKDACQYCSYKSVCAMDKKDPKAMAKKVNLMKMKPEEAYEKIIDVVNGSSDEGKNAVNTSDANYDSEGEK